MRTIPDYLLRNADTLPEAPFLRLLDGEGAVSTHSYRAVMAEAWRWAGDYASAGVRPGDRVVIILKHSLDLYTAFLGALLGGQVPALFTFPSPKLSEEEYFKSIGALLDNAEPAMVVVYPELRDRLAARLADRRPAGLFHSPGELRPASGPPASAPVPDPGATAFLQYSSGTTGIKKGVAVSHAALLWQVETYAKAIRATRQDLIVSWLPLYHDMGLIACLFLPFLEGIPLVAMSPFDWVLRPALLARAVAEFRGTLAWMPNFAFQFMAQNIPAAEAGACDLSSLRGVVNCSEPVMTSSLREFQARFAAAGLEPGALATCYAMAENTFAVSSGGFGTPLVEDRIDARAFAATGRAIPVAPGHPDARVLVGSGRLLPGVEVDILDAEGRDLPEREVGEIAIRSPCLLDGYHRNPEATSQAFRDGRYLTGDLGYLAGGELFVTGRKKDLIIIGGHNLYPQDLEAIVNEVPGVIPGRNVALGIPDPSTGTERLVILAESEDTDPDRREALRTAIFGAIASRTDAVPKEIRVLPRKWLLKSSSGKIARAGNLAKYLAESAETAASVVAREKSVDSGMEERVRNCVARVLARSPAAGLARLDGRTPLVSSGLVDSLTLADLLSALESETGVILPPHLRPGAAGFDNIAGIAATLRSLSEGAGDPVGEALPAGDSPIGFRIEGRPRSARKPAGFWTWYYRLLLRAKGVRFGRGLRVLGPLILRLEGDPSHLRIGDDVTLMPGVDLKTREQGRIILGDGVFLDTSVRLVAANDARIELGDEVQVAIGTVMNAGADILVGRLTAIGGYCSLIASEHKMARGMPIMGQGYNHSPIRIGEDVWLASHVHVGRGSRIGDGAVAGIRSSVTGTVPPYAVWAGSPGRVIKYRS